MMARLKGIKRSYAIGALLLLAAAGGGYYLYSQNAASDAAPAQGRRGPGADGRPQPVSVAEVRTQDLPIWINALESENDQQIA